MTIPATAPPTCPYCHEAAIYLAKSAELYHGFDYGPAWVCRPCKAWVGCHPNGTPLGRLADAPLRKAKQAAHAQFDVLWAYKARTTGINRNHARGKAYKWLAEQMGMEVADCHIGMFDVALCNRVADICAPWVAKLPPGERHTSMEQPAGKGRK